MNSSNPSIPPTKLLTETETSMLLSVSRKTLQAWRWRRVGPPWVKLQGAVRYSYMDLMDYLESHKNIPGSADMRR